MRFRKTYIEITNTCDLACTFCPGSSRPPAFMTRELFTSALLQLRGITSLLHFHVMGEPLLHPEIGHFLDLCAEHGHRVNLVTNGGLLARRMGDLLGKPALKQISISLQSLEHPDRDDRINSIGSFIDKARMEPTLAISLRLWTFDHQEEHPAHQNILSHLQRMFSITQPLCRTLRTNSSVIIDKNLYINTAPRFEWPDPDGPDLEERGTCLGLREQCAILADGTVVPCCLDRNAVMNLGNIRDRPLAEILAGERAATIRNGFIRGAVAGALCRKCTYRRRFDHAG